MNMRYSRVDMFDLSDTIAVGIGITAFVATLVALFIFFTAYNERSARIAGYATMWLAIWSWLGFGYHLTENLWLARELRVLSVASQMVGQIFALKFVYAYLSEVRPITPREELLYKLLYAGNVFFIILFLADALGTKIIIGDLLGPPAEVLTPEPGPGMLWLLIFYFTLPFTYGYILLQRVLIEKGKRRQADIIITIGMVGAFLLGGFGFAPWYEITSPFILLRGLAIPFYCVAMVYSITNYQLFNLRVAAAEAFVFAMWGFLFLRILLQPSFREAIPDIAILVAVIALGLLLIRNVTKELQVRIELEEVSEKLRELNNSLGEKVMERTRDLERARQHIEQMVDHLPVGLIEINDKDQIVRMNNIAEELLGVDRRAAVGKQLQSHRTISNLMGETLSSGTREVHIESPREIDLEVVTAPLLLEDSRGYVVVMRDITEKRVLERAKNEFISTAAHQLRTPISSIKWTFELLDSQKLPKKQHEILSNGKQGVVNLERIAEGLMMSIRTSQGASNYSFEETSIAPILENIVMMVTPLAEKKKIALQISVPEGLPLMRLDTERIGFAIQNLLDNAIRYTPEGGNVSLQAVHESGNLIIKIADSGIGIAPEDKEHLFEKFFRSKEATQMSTDGSGLGLVIVKSIVEAHGGSISAESEHGSGSTFRIILPVHTRNA